MKRILFSIILNLNVIYSYSQNIYSYECKDISQRDSISNDLKSKGFYKNYCDLNGLFLNLQDDNSYCHSFSQMSKIKVTLNEFYEVVKKITHNKKENICSDVDVEADKFNGEIKYNSPDLDNISFVKYKKKGVIDQYVSISIYDTYLSGYNNYGLSILFRSGKKIIRSKEKVDVHSSSGANWRYSVFFRPLANEINLFKIDEIVAIKLYIFDADITKGNTIKDYANCVLVTPKAPLKK